MLVSVRDERRFIKDFKELITCYEKSKSYKDFVYGGADNENNDFLNAPYIALCLLLDKEQGDEQVLEVLNNKDLNTDQKYSLLMAISDTISDGWIEKRQYKEIEVDKETLKYITLLGEDALYVYNTSIEKFNEAVREGGVTKNHESLGSIIKRIHEGDKKTPPGLMTIVIWLPTLVRYLAFFESVDFNRIKGFRNEVINNTCKYYKKIGLYEIIPKEFVPEEFR